MISPFLKKLLFARQFSMVGGKIDILGKKQVLLPADIIFDLGKIDPKAAYKSVKQAMQKDMVDYARKLGSTDEGMLNVISELFETFGLGSMEIVDLDNKRRRCIIRIHSQPSMDGKDNKDEGTITSAALSGVFSFLFKKDVNPKKVSAGIRGTNYDEYVVS